MILLFIPEECSARLEEKGKLNVLFIVVDDLNTRIGAMGDSLAKTPNIDRLAKRGVLFSQAYCQYAVCGPSRSSFLSGLRPETGKVFDNSIKEKIFDTPAYRVTQLPEVFKNSGYYTARLGKVYHSAYDLPRSWNHSSEATPNNKVTYPKDEFDAVKAVADELEDLRNVVKWEAPQWAKVTGEESSLKDYRITAETLAAMDKATQDHKNFFIAVGLNRPHLPWLAPLEYFTRFDTTTFPTQEEAFLKPANGKFDAATYQRVLRAYYAAASYTDAQVGKLMARMDEKSLWENTIVVLIGDNGYELGERDGFFGKGGFCAAHSRVPVIVVAPGLPQGATCNNPIELLDIYPTVAELAGMSAPPHLEGKSRMAMLRSPQTDEDSVAVTIRTTAPVNDRPGELIGHCIRDKRWTYVKIVSSDKGFQSLNALYDRVADPMERVNLMDSENPEIIAVKASMESKLGNYLKEAKPYQGNVVKD